MLWIRRGKGHGGGYASKVGRRCLNEGALLASVKRHLGHRLLVDALELADVPFALQMCVQRAQK